MAAILNSAILDSTILVFPFKLTYTCQDWFPPFAQKKNLHSFILTQLDVDGHLEYHHFGFSHLSLSSQTHSYLPRLGPTICTKKTSLTLPSPPFAQKDFILTQLNESAILNSAILNSAILDSVSALWNTDTLLSPLRFPQKHSPSTLTLTQTNLIWLKLIHSHLNWWWQPSWILTSWIPPS